MVLNCENVQILAINVLNSIKLILWLISSKVCHSNPSQRTRFIRCIYNLLNSNSAAVRYEAAGTLVTLSSAPTAVRVGYRLLSSFIFSKILISSMLSLIII